MHRLIPGIWAIYKNQLLISEYNVDHEVIREYLPMEQCLSGMLEIYSGAAGIGIQESGESFGLA